METKLVPSINIAMIEKSKEMIGWRRRYLVEEDPKE
jgi:hypothetical protein